MLPRQCGSCDRSRRRHRGPEKRRQARPPCDAGAPPQHSPAAPRRPPGRVRARRLTGTGGRHEGQGEQPPHRRLRGTGRECCPAAAGCAAAASAAIDAAHTLAGFGGAAEASPQAAARTAKGRHAADAAHPVCTRQPECAALVARLAAREWFVEAGYRLEACGLVAHALPRISCPVSRSNVPCRTNA